ncbi:MAG: aspartate kinase, partial [bacterium]
MTLKKKLSAIKVVKFGGSSLADARQIRKVYEIVRVDPARRIVVVSAPGKRSPEDMKVTDLLIALAEAQLAGEPTDAALDRVVERFREIQRALELPVTVTRAVADDLRKRLAGDTTHRGRFLDNLKAAGEDNCARVVAAAFKKFGLPAHYVDPRTAGLLLSDDFGNATVLPESYERLKTLRDTRDVVIFPGFFGYTGNGEVATFPRGGSDITGSILAAAVQAELYENFTDVDSVYAVDPRIVPDARAISILTYQEMRELAYAGFGVFHDEAILPAVQAKIPICIKNT